MNQTVITADRNGWLTITLPTGLEIIVPQDDMGDARCEVRCEGRRLWVEQTEDGPLASDVERYS